jgi:protein farnesyltransferase subunit beta
MVSRIKSPRVHRKVIFMSKEDPQPVLPSERLGELSSDSAKTKQYNIESTSSGIFEDAEEDSTTSGEEEEFLFTSGYEMQRPDDPLIPKLFTSPPILGDLLKTVSSTAQDLTVQECLPFLTGSEGLQKSALDINAHGVPHLDREGHIAFLHGSLGGLPSGFAALDASRPWMIYWALTGLYLLGEDVSPYRDRCVFSTSRKWPTICPSFAARMVSLDCQFVEYNFYAISIKCSDNFLSSVISTLTPMRNRDGGFGGGPGQLSHLAPTYAAILSLVMVGGDEAFGTIDRKML